MIAKLGAIIFILLTFAFVVAAIVYGNQSAEGADAEAVRQHERLFDLLRGAAFCSFICALFFGAMAELKRELEGIHTTLVLQRTSTSQSPPEQAPAVTAAAAAPARVAPAQPGLAHGGNGPHRATPAPVQAGPTVAPAHDIAVEVTPNLQRWFVAGRDAAGQGHTAYLDAPDRDSAFAAAIARGLKEVTTIEPRQRAAVDVKHETAGT